jgi:hypothetical protein
MMILNKYKNKCSEFNNKEDKDKTIVLIII